MVTWWPDFARVSWESSLRPWVYDIAGSPPGPTASTSFSTHHVIAADCRSQRERRTSGGNNHKRTRIAVRLPEPVAHAAFSLMLEGGDDADSERTIGTGYRVAEPQPFRDAT